MRPFETRNPATGPPAKSSVDQDQGLRRESFYPGGLNASQQELLDLG